MMPVVPWLLFLQATAKSAGGGGGGGGGGAAAEEKKQVNDCFRLKFFSTAVFWSSLMSCCEC